MSRKQVRHGVGVAFIAHVGPVKATLEMVGVMETWVEYIITGKAKPGDESLSEAELDIIANNFKDPA